MRVPPVRLTTATLRDKSTIEGRRVRREGPPARRPRRAESASESQTSRGVGRPGFFCANIVDGLVAQKDTLKRRKFEFLCRNVTMESVQNINQRGVPFNFFEFLNVSILRRNQLHLVQR